MASASMRHRYRHSTIVLPPLRLGSNFCRSSTTFPATLLILDSYVYETMYTISIALTKISILLFYSRIFTERKFRIALGVTCALVTTWLIAIELVVLAECVPISGLWDLTQPARCISLIPFFVASGVPNVILNVIIVGLPLPMIWTLDVEKKYRWALSAVFGLGALYVVLAQNSVLDLTCLQRHRCLYR